ncbi:NAD-dependent dehydratase [Bradyrhizobium nitroreducens]|uniref:NAD-dependent dehydratase n=1 Tax=Bradyrhizobium nitroreducens TaxID=709803 RepID=A0A2M6U9D4_9BRAD|nr:NAD-dependent dehydratase [Bradyrhizobium nitroreducens]PIT01202.1 NAD-dependent dehydratase [Bradyrhizobium nitroreducens]
MTTLLIVGATGLVGGRAMTLALADSRITRIIAPTRRALPPEERVANPRLDDLIAGAGDDDWRADGAICALGTTRAAAGSAAAFRAVDYDLALRVARRLREAGVVRLALVSALGADPRSPFLYPRTKGELEQAIGALGFPSLTILRPGFLDGERAESRPIEQAVGKVLRFVAPVLPRVARVSSVTQVARQLIEAAVAGTPGIHIIGAAQLADGGD